VHLDLSTAQVYRDAEMKQNTVAGANGSAYKDRGSERVSRKITEQRSKNYYSQMATENYLEKRIAIKNLAKLSSAF
jgi:hypothetical protein